MLKVDSAAATSGYQPLLLAACSTLCVPSIVTTCVGIVVCRAVINYAESRGTTTALHLMGSASA
jgi:hypothetical protein